MSLKRSVAGAYCFIAIITFHFDSTVQGADASTAGIISPENTFALSIVPTSSMEGRTPTLDCPSTFYVVLTNISERPVAIYEDESAWGYYNLKFEFKNNNGQCFELKRANREFFWNSPSSFAVLPGHHYVLKVDFGPKTWPMLRNMNFVEAKMNFQVKAVFEEPNDRALPEDSHPNIWKGRVESQSELFYLRILHF